MNELRNIRTEEIDLLKFMLEKLNLDTQILENITQVDDYEGAKMGSIGLGKDGAEYAGDIIQAEYIDIDNVPVVITLTKDTQNQLLDLDFWKTDFSKLQVYPTPEKLIFKENYTPSFE